MDKSAMSPADEEASEKLVAPDGDKIEIRPLAVVSQNGDTRIDIAEVREAFVGMGKEELMKFASDPFWVKLRWFLFAMFWVLWFGMLFGAVAIIAYAPKCTAPADRSWFQESPLYYLNADQIKDSSSNDVPLSQGLLLVKDHLQNLGIKSLLLDINSEKSEDFKTLPKKYGSQEELKKSLSTLKEAGIHTFLKIVPNHVSINHPWFVQSVAKKQPYTSYFVWARGKESGSNPETSYPNNWLSFDGGPAWAYNANRSEFYLHQANASFADLNFRNPEVVATFSDVLKYWLDFGFCGIHLEKVANLVEDSKLRDELPSPLNPGGLGDYNFLTHSNTANLDETYDILMKWGQIFTNSSGILSVDQVSDPFNISAKLVQRPFVLQQNSNSTQDQLKSYIQTTIMKSHHTWLVDPESTKRLSFPATLGINLLFILLPDTPLIMAGLELGHPPNQPLVLPFSKSDGADNNKTGSLSSQELYKIMKKAIGLRSTPSIENGDTKVLANTTLVLIERFKTGNPGYLIALNPDTLPHNLNFTAINTSGAENYKPVIISPNFREANPEVVLDKAINSTEVTLPPSSFAILEFVIAST